MHTHRVVIGLLLIGLIGCKTSSVPSSSEEVYKEDLAYLRPSLSEEIAEVPEPETPKLNATLPTGHLKTELDSVNQIIISNNRAQRYVDGYTIQIYTGNDREAATEAMNKAMSIDPQLDPQIQYYQPSYKVKAGQYINRLEAHEVFERLKVEFPLALLIPERIRVDYD
ncbi:SPOR domain-containing protein [Marinoscillum luteum]|uniref:SPOR domain-containing protein n=1 Tax=Marinoscillum luteum TaxID=861051 RepID=A0ABW7NBF9_9BACT